MLAQPAQLEVGRGNRRWRSGRGSSSSSSCSRRTGCHRSSSGFGTGSSWCGPIVSAAECVRLCCGCCAGSCQEHGALDEVLIRGASAGLARAAAELARHWGREEGCGCTPLNKQGMKQMKCDGGWEQVGQSVLSPTAAAAPSTRLRRPVLAACTPVDSLFSVRVLKSMPPRDLRADASTVRQPIHKHITQRHRAACEEKNEIGLDSGVTGRDSAALAGLLGTGCCMA